MNDKTILEIEKIDRRPVIKKNGEQSMIIAVTDARTKRIAETWDQEWTASWKIGDAVEVIFGESKQWTNPKNNVTKETWPISNPNAVKKAGPSTSRGSNPEDSAWIIAATLMAPQFVGKKIDLKVVAELVEAVKIARTPAAPVAAAAILQTSTGQINTAPVAQPTVQSSPVTVTPPIAAVEDSYVEDEDKPF